MANLEKVIRINETDYGTLVGGDTITKDGVEYEYDDSALYVIENPSPPAYALTAGQANTAVKDVLGRNIVDTYLTEGDKVSDVKVKVGTGTAVSIVDSNKVVNVVLDTTPTANSTNPVTSGGIKTALDTKVAKVTSTDNAIARFDGTDGQIQNSGVTINDSNQVTAAKFITSGGTSSQFVKGDGSLDSTTYTPQTSAGANSLLSSLPNWTPIPTDTTRLVRRDISGNTSFGQVTFLTVWNYIKSKISSDLGIGGDNGVPTAPTAASGTNTTQIATTAFVQDALSNMGAGGSEMVDVTITGTTSSASFSANPYNAIKAVVDDGKIAVLNASVAPLSITGVLIPVYEYTYSQSGTDYTGYKGKIQNGNYEISVDVQSTSSATVSITSVGSSITVDTALSESSTNPVQNRVITAQILENEEIVATALNNLNDRVELKQDQLVSGTTIKTINNQSILGSGNISISGGGGGSGEENVIESITFNGTAVPVDANKNAAITADVPFVVNISRNNNGDVFTADKTFNEVVAALDAGKVIIGKWNVVGESDDSYGSVYSGVYVSQDEGYIHFVNTEGDYYERFTLSYDNSITREAAPLATQDFVTVRGVKVNSTTAPITNKYAEITLKTVNNNSLVGSGNISVGTYSKPSGGIPASDLASAVQTSLGLADSALQSYTETDPVFGASAASSITSSNIATWNGKYTKPSGGIPDTDLTTAVNVRLLPTISGSSDIGKIARVNSSYSSYELVEPITVYSGSSAPSSSTGSNGDIYIQTS